MSFDREFNHLQFESAGLAGARRVDPLEVIQSHASVIKQELRCAYRHKCSARLQSAKLKCGPLAVEPQSFTFSSSSFTDCESASSDSDLTYNFLLISSNEGGVTDLNDSIDSVTTTCNKSPSSLRSDSKKFSNVIFNPFVLNEFPDYNSDSDVDSDINFISTPEKVVVTISTLVISASTFVSFCERFPARTFHSQASQ